MMTKRILILLSLLFLGCVTEKGDIKVKGLAAPAAAPIVSNITLTADRKQIVITGSKLDLVKQIQISSPIAHTFDIDTQSSSEIRISPSSALTLTMGVLYNFLISDAKGAAAYSVNFALQQMGANTGDFLQWNGTTWTPAPITGPNLLGTWDAAANLTNAAAVLANGGVNTAPAAGDYYVVSVADGAGGTIIDGEDIWTAGDWIFFNGTTWTRIQSTLGVTSFNGRQGAVIPTTGDYTINQIASTPGGYFTYAPNNVACSAGEVMKWSGTEWICGVDNGAGAASSTTDQVIEADSDANASGEIQFRIGGMIEARVTNAGNMQFGSDIGTGGGKTFSIGDTLAPATFMLGETNNDRFAVNWSPNGKYVSFATKEAGVDYGDTLVLKSGTVGIGTSTPNAKLDIYGGDAVFNDQIRLQGTTGDPYSIQLSDTNAINGGALVNRGTNQRVFSFNANREVGFGALGNHGPFNAIFNVLGISGRDTVQILPGDGPVVMIKNDGMMGIGTSTPQGKLSVMGDIHATEICDETGANCHDISTGWATGGGGVFTANGSYVYYDGMSPVGVGLIPPDSQYKMILMGTSPSMSPLSLRIDRGSSDTSFNRIIGFNNEAFTQQYAYFGISSNIFQMRSGSGGPGTNFDLGTNSNGDFLRLQQTGGALGVGNITPTLAFEVSESIPDTTAGTVLNSTPVVSFYANSTPSDIQRGLEIGAPASGIAGPVFLKVKGTSNRFAVVDDNDDENFTILDSGFVGIGEATPIGNLHINGGNNSTSYLANATEQAFRLHLKTYNTAINSEVFRLGLGHNSNDLNGWIGFWRGGGIGGGELSFGANAVELMRLNAAGNVGIGNTTPTGKLTVTGGPIHAEQICDEFGLNCMDLSVSGTTYWSQSGGDVNYTGSVGINTSTPTSSLTIASGDIQLDNNQQIKFKRASGATDPYIGYDSSDNFKIFNPVNAEIQFSVNSGQVASFNSNGLKMNGSKSIQGTGAADTLSVDGNSGLSLRASQAGGNGNISFMQGAYEAMTILPNGYVGIGTSTPTMNFTVVGNQHIYSNNMNAHAVQPALDIMGAWIRLGDGLGGDQTFPNGLGIKFHDGTVSHASMKYDTVARKMYLGHSSGNGNSLILDGSPTATFDVVNNFVGIGIESPNNALQVANGDVYIGRPLSGLAHGLIIQNENVITSKLGQLKYKGDTLYMSGITGNQYFNFGRNYNSTGSAFSQMNFDINSNAVPSSFNFLVDNTSMMYILENGNVGIGSTSPQGKLDLGSGTSGNSIVWAGGTGTSHYATIGTSYSSADLNIMTGLQLDSTVDDHQYSYDGTYATAGIEFDFSSGEILFYNQGSAAHTKGTSFDEVANQKMVIAPSGYVGIGTTSPTATLDLKGNIVFDRGNGNVTLGSDIYMNAQGIIASDNNMYFNTDIDNDGTGAIYFAKGAETDSATKMMTILNNGNVGIGTSTPTAKLQVDGRILASTAEFTKPVVRVNRTTSASIANGGWLTAVFAAETIDTENMHDNVTNNSRLTAPITGIYRVSATCSFDSNGAGVRSTGYMINGGALVVISMVGAGAGSPAYSNGSDMISLTAGDYVEIQCHQNSGGALNMNSGTNAYLEWVSAP